MAGTSFSTSDEGPSRPAGKERPPPNNDNKVPPPKRLKASDALRQAAPLADRMRPQTLDEVCGQELVGPNGVLRGLIEQDRVPSMILWGGPGTGKTTIARVIGNVVGSRVVEINSTSSGVVECKKIFTEARAELSLTGRKTILFCDEIHRFSKSQQDVFLGPVESGQVTLIGATTENPSFKIQSALLSRCRTFVLAKLTKEDVVTILHRALDREKESYISSTAATTTTSPSSLLPISDSTWSGLLDAKLVDYLADFSDGDARTALNLLELAMGLSTRPGMTQSEIQRALTRTFVYDRAGDQHYDTISAFHKSIRGNDPDATLYYLGRMLESGEDPLFIARRMIVVASEDIGLADSSMLPLATACYTAVEKVGLPEARINLAHAAVAMALSKKSTRVYRGLGRVLQALQGEPGVAGLPVPIHLKNAPTRLMKELGVGKEYKYNPNYREGKVAQEVRIFVNAPVIRTCFYVRDGLINSTSTPFLMPHLVFFVIFTSPCFSSWEVWHYCNSDSAFLTTRLTYIFRFMLLPPSIYLVSLVPVLPLISTTFLVFLFYLHSYISPFSFLSTPLLSSPLPPPSLLSPFSLIHSLHLDPPFIPSFLHSFIHHHTPLFPTTPPPPPSQPTLPLSPLPRLQPG